MKSTTLTAFALGVSLIGCADPDVDTRRQESFSGDVAWPGGDVCKNVTVSGKVLYNDLRSAGRFQDRRALFAGERHPYEPVGPNMNYLGLWDATVKIYEVDSLTNTTCETIQYEGSTVINSDGSWRWTGQICDRCRSDLDGAGDLGVSVAAQVVLSSCASPETRCFSVADPDAEADSNHFDDDWGGLEWSRWYHDAGVADPRVIVGGQTTVDLGLDFFQEAWGWFPGDPRDVFAQAASVFASMVDVTRRVHIDEGVPFDYATRGKINAYFPHRGSDNSHSHQGASDRLCVPLPDDAWVEGSEAAHEYGHLLHYWAWGGVGKWASYCYDSDGDGHLDLAIMDDPVIGDWDVDGDGDMANECDESSSQREYALAALKEGWARFVAGMTFNGNAGVPNTCGDRGTRTPLADSFRDHAGNAVCAVGGACPQGRHFIDDVAQALCDLWDGTEDQSNGATDRLELALPDLVDTLAVVYAEASDRQRADIDQADFGDDGEWATAALGLCELAEKLIAGGVPSDDVAETLAVTHIECDVGSWVGAPEAGPIETPRIP